MQLADDSATALLSYEQRMAEVSCCCCTRRMCSRAAAAQFDTIVREQWRLMKDFLAAEEQWKQWMDAAQHVAPADEGDYHARVRESAADCVDLQLQMTRNTEVSSPLNVSICY